MAVFRVERTRDYTVMSNYHLKDTGLTLKAKGLLSMMLSLPDEWNLQGKRGDDWQNPPGAGKRGIFDPQIASGQEWPDHRYRVHHL